MITNAIFRKSDTGYDVEFPEFPGGLTCGETFEQAFDMAKDAAQEWINHSLPRDVRGISTKELFLLAVESPVVLMDVKFRG